MLTTLRVSERPSSPFGLSHPAESASQVCLKTPLPVSPRFIVWSQAVASLCSGLSRYCTSGCFGTLEQQLFPGRVVSDGEAVARTADCEELTMMSMTFEVSSSVTLLFDFWSVRGPAGMVLSVFVVLLLAVFFEVLKVWRVWLSCKSKLAQPRGPYAAPPPFGSDSSSVLESSPSESSLTPMEHPPRAPDARKRWLLHGSQAVLHMLQVTLGYMLMLCAMSYNTWIFLGIVAGSVLGYFISFPLLGKI